MGGGWGDQVDLLIVVSTIKLQGPSGSHTKRHMQPIAHTTHYMYVCMYSMGGVAASQVGVDHNIVKMSPCRLKLLGFLGLLPSLKLGYSYRPGPAWFQQHKRPQCLLDC